MELFKNMNRKKRREFEKLTNEQKVELAVNEIKQNLAREQAAKASVLFLDGGLYVCKVFQNDYLDKITDDNKDEIIERLIADIMERCKKYDERFPQKEDKVEESEEN